MFSSTQSRIFRASLGVEPLILLAMLLLPRALIAQSASAAEKHQQRANAYLSQNNPKLAIPEFRAILKADPNNLEAQANLGVLLFFQRDYTGAVSYLRQALAQNSGLSKIHALLGLAEMYLGQPKQARADLEASVPKLAEPKIRIQAGLALIEIDVDSRDLDKAARVVALLRDVAPTDPRVLYTAYRIASEQAGEAMLSLSLVAPDSAQMHAAMADELGRTLDISGAIANLRKAAELDPMLPGIHYKLAEALQQVNEEKLRPEAESQFKLALEQNPRDARSAVALGDLAKNRGDVQASIRYYTQAFAIDPQLPDAEIALASLDADKGNFAAAALKLERVVQADPSNMLAHYHLRAIYQELGRPDDAKRELAAFLHYRKLREKMEATYQEMRQQAPGEEGGKADK